MQTAEEHYLADLLPADTTLTPAQQRLVPLPQRQKAPVGWKQKALSEIETERSSQSFVRFTVLNALQNLINAVK